MELSDHFRLREIDRIEAEKKNQVLLKKVFAICLKKGFHFDMNPNSESLSVSIDNFKTTVSSYYKGDLINYNSLETEYKTMTVLNLLEYLKK